MAKINKVKVKKTGEIREIEDSTARANLAKLREEFDKVNSVTHNGKTYSAIELLDFLAELYESNVWVDEPVNEDSSE